MKQLVGEDMEAYALRREEEMRVDRQFRIVRFRKSARSEVNIFDSAEFQLQLLDLGGGAVNTTLARGTGTATFTRATTAWTKLASGLWASVATGVARSSYIGLNTAVTAYGGYLAEGAGTQLVTPTASIRDMTDASWVKVTMTTAFTSTGIGGVANSCTRCTATGASATILQTLTAAASSRTYSCWIKRITGTGTIGICQDGVTFTDITAQINSSTFTLVQLNASQLNAAFGIQIVTSGDAIDVDFNQFEAGPFATTPMDVAGAAVRNGDSLTYVQSGNINLPAGTIYAEYSVEGLNGVRAYLVDINDIGNARVSLRGEDTGPPAYPTLAYGDGAANYGVFDLTSITTNSITKVAAAWGSTGGRLARTGIALASVANPAAPTGNTNIGIGVNNAGTGNQLYGGIKNVRIWQTQLSDATLQALTT